jgi:6-phosphogluconate dehydrogenase
MNVGKTRIGMIGLGVMGRNLLLNMADHGHAAAGYDRDVQKLKVLDSESEDRPILAAKNVNELVGSLSRPRVAMMLVPAGDPVDGVIRDLLPHLEQGDIIIDGGNSHFEDTNLRSRTLAEKGIMYLGTGISGGAHGARHGPSMMPGGDREAYAVVQPIFEAVSAHVKGEPCVSYLGPGSAGHFVKMVHNGIEYALMQLIAETYDLMKRGLSLSDDELHGVYSEWNESELGSYLLEITAHIFTKVDEQTGKKLIDVILDAAKQKGTGKWTSQEGMDRQIPLPTIDSAVAMRNLSALEEKRTHASRSLTWSMAGFGGSRDAFIGELKDALYLSMVIAFSQGMDLLRSASAVHHYRLELETVARIWRGGCIIRANMLELIRSAYRKKPDLDGLLVVEPFRTEASRRQGALRSVVRTAVELGLPASAFMASLSYLDALRNDWLPANLIQAQRDYFGAHTYERIDERGTFHTRWEPE